MSEHCNKCCDEDLGVRLIAAMLQLWLCWWAASYFLPPEWPFWKRMAAVVIVVGLWR